jgi:hypothetical protein
LISIKIASPNHLQAIGLVATYWSKMEWLTEELIWRLSGLDDSLTGHALTAELGVRTRFDVLLTLAGLKIRKTEQESRLKAIQKRVISGYEGQPSLSSERNRIIHAYWSDAGGQSAFASKIKARGKLSFDLRTMTASEIYDVAQKYSWQLMS